MAECSSWSTARPDVTSHVFESTRSGAAEVAQREVVLVVLSDLDDRAHGAVGDNPAAESLVSRVGVLPLFHTTKTLPSTGLTTGKLLWSKLQALAAAFLSNVSRRCTAATCR